MSAPQQNARKISEQFYAILSKEREQQSVLRTQTACWFENAVKDHDGEDYGSVLNCFSPHQQSQQDTSFRV